MGVIIHTRVCVRFSHDVNLYNPSFTQVFVCVYVRFSDDVNLDNLSFTQVFTCADVGFSDNVHDFVILVSRGCSPV